MKFFLLLCFLAVTTSAPAEEPVPILRQEADVGIDGNYHHSFETGDGTIVEEKGTLKNAGSPDNEIAEVTGSFTYTDNEGNKFSVHYVANENGFQPEGDHLPTPPPIPEAIQKALEWNAAHPEEDNQKR